MFYSINQLILVVDSDCVHCEGRTEVLQQVLVQFG